MRPHNFQNDMGSNARIGNNDIEFTETQINPSDFTCKIIKRLNFFNISFNNNENKFLSLTYGCRNDVAVLEKVDANGVSIFTFKKHDFVDRAFTLMLRMREIFQSMPYFLAANSIDTITGDFNCDLLKVTENKLLDIFIDPVQIVTKPRHISRSLTDHVYIKKSLME